MSRLPPPRSLPGPAAAAEAAKLLAPTWAAVVAGGPQATPAHASAPNGGAPTSSQDRAPFPPPIHDPVAVLRTAALLEPSVANAITAAISRRAAAPASGVAAASTQRPQAPAPTGVARSPIQAEARCKGVLQQLEKEKADFMTTAAEKQEAALKAKEAGVARLRQAIADATAALADFEAHEDASAAAWSTHRADRILAIDAKIADARLEVEAAKTAVHAAGDRAAMKPPAEDKDDEDALSDSCSESSLGAMDAIGHVEVMPYVQPPTIEHPVSEADAPRLATTLKLLCHWIQQSADIPLRFSALGVTPGETKGLVGSTIWDEQYAANATVTSEDYMPKRVAGVLLDALVRLSLDRQAAAAAHSQTALLEAASALQAKAKAEPKKMTKPSAKKIPRTRCVKKARK